MVSKNIIPALAEKAGSIKTCEGLEVSAAEDGTVLSDNSLQDNAGCREGS